MQSLGHCYYINIYKALMFEDLGPDFDIPVPWFRLNLDFVIEAEP